MNLCKYQRSRTFIDLGPRSLRFNIFKHLFLRNSWANWRQIFMWSLYRMGEQKCVQTVQVTWPVWPPCSYMVKTLKKSSSLEPKGQWPSKLVCSIGYSSTTKFVQMMTLVWPWPILWQGQIWTLMLLYGEKGKTMDFSETIVVYDIKVDRCSQLKWVHEALWVPEVKVIHWPWSKSLRFNICKLLFLNNH